MFKPKVSKLHHNLSPASSHVSCLCNSGGFETLPRFHFPHPNGEFALYSVISHRDALHSIFSWVFFCVANGFHCLGCGDLEIDGRERRMGTKEMFKKQRWEQCWENWMVKDAAKKINWKGLESNFI